MKNFILVEKIGVGAHYIQMPSDFRVDVYEDEGDVYVCFADGDYDTIIKEISFALYGYVKGKNLDDYPPRAQRLIVAELREYIWKDIDKFLADNKDEEYYNIFPLSDFQIFQCDEFLDRCEMFYDLVINSIGTYLDEIERKQQ